ncbi:MAG: hypothetical protein GEU73_07895 [Chloroflexi bacterium]|nr:hypothetical protein [Chloroflexota bacterium]
MIASRHLADLRVLDLSRDGAAAGCARILALLGAHVQHVPVPYRPGIQALVRDHPWHTIVTDLLPSEARRAGLTPTALLTVAPVVVSVTPFGLDGPDAESADILRAFGPFGDRVASELAGAHAAAGALAALRWARGALRTVHVEVATFDVVASCLGDNLPRAICPLATQRSGDARRDIGARIEVLPCADGWVGIAAPTAVDRAHLAGLTGVDEVAVDDADLAALVRPWLARRSRWDVFSAAQLWRLPIVPVLSAAEAQLGEQRLACNNQELRAAHAFVPRSPFRIDVRQQHASTHGCRESSEPDPLDGRGSHQSTPRRPPTPSSQRASRDAPRLPLSDICVLDLGMVWAGPHAGRLLAGLGARVVKIEGPNRPDGTRPDVGCLGAFGDLNRGKASLVLDLAHELGREAFLRLVSRADVLVENFSPRVMPNFGLDDSVLSAVNSRLVMLSMPAFGSDGSWAHAVAYGSGLELITGLGTIGPDGRPAPAPVPYLDYLSGAYGAVGVLAALLARETSGDGVRLEIAQRDVACQLLRGWRSSQQRHVDRGVRIGDHMTSPSMLTAREIDWTSYVADFASDRHLAARELFTSRTTERKPCHHYARPPWRLHGIPFPDEGPAPAFGADSRPILEELARMDTEAIDRLVGAGVVVAADPDGPLRTRDRRLGRDDLPRGEP